ncbi:anti-sigma F factor antagonist [Clostridium sp. 19966]|uniref:anti-sigma F factor antagonist n=1 Tax=Clostridium sp. 19966 TaxID=2768166 RepID=UPI0028E0777A|nr:anti-sigma F factor antagonist [Clostridium sp. 19966]MDT8716504.1 anti-sigma F factor antagonist [Clostridium sp. 19966]
MYIRFDKKDNILIAYLLGELDHHSAEEVRSKIDDKIDREKVNKLIISFYGVTFMDSSGIGVVVGRYKKLSMRKGIVCIAEAKDPVKKVFELSGMFKIIHSYESIDDAVVNM